MKELWNKYGTNILFCLLIVIILIYYNWKSVLSVKIWLGNNVTIVALIFSGLSSIVALLALLYNIKINNRTQKQYQESLAPVLVFKLIEIKGVMYLQITNKGRTGAKNLSVRYLGLRNNGEKNLVSKNQLSNPFDLFPEESVQGLVALYGLNSMVYEIGVLPVLELEAEYLVAGTKNKVMYKRNVTYFRKEESNDLYLSNLSQVNHNLKTLNRAVLRIANYFDGYAVMEFDVKNYSPRTSLKNDLIDALHDTEKDEILSREETLEDYSSINQNEIEK